MQNRISHVCFREKVSLHMMCLISQMFNPNRLSCDMDEKKLVHVLAALQIQATLTLSFSPTSHNTRLL